MSAEVVAAASRFVRGLTCRVCGRLFPPSPTHYCEDDFGPLQVCYDTRAAAEALTQETLSRRPRTMWRYRELLPLDGEPTIGTQVGMTPMLRARRLGESLGVERLWLKNEAASFPTSSFKDRVVAVALNKAVEFGMTTVACSSTGNLADSVAALAASAGLEAYVFVPEELDPSRLTTMQAHGAKVIRVQGTYDEANRLCSQAADRFGWGFVNVNLRPFYVEGAKTVGFEIAEQLGWRVPRHVVVPLASGGLLCPIHQAFEELGNLKLIPEAGWSMHAAQPSGCNPVVEAVKQGLDAPRPVRDPKTTCHSLAVGDPGDGIFVLDVIRRTGGWAEDATDAEIADAVLLLARTEGVLVEPAGGVVVAATRKLIEQGRVGRDEDVVLCLTGGLKERLPGLPSPPVIAPRLGDLVSLMKST